MACEKCKALSYTAGKLVRCSQHPLKHGGFEYRDNVHTAQSEKTIRGKTVLVLEEVNWKAPDPGRVTTVQSEWPARAPAGRIPERVPFLWTLPGISRRANLTLQHQDKGWGPLSKASPQYEPGWWQEMLYGLKDRDELAP